MSPRASRDAKADAANSPEAVAAAEEDRRHATLHDDTNSPIAFLRASETMGNGDSLRGLWFVCQRTGMLHLVLSDGTVHHAMPGDDLRITIGATTPSPEVIGGDGRTSRDRVTTAMRDVLSRYDSDDAPKSPTLDEALYDAVLASLTTPEGRS